MGIEEIKKAKEEEKKRLEAERQAERTERIGFRIGKAQTHSAFHRWNGSYPHVIDCNASDSAETVRRSEMKKEIAFW